MPFMWCFLAWRHISIMGRSVEYEMLSTRSHGSSGGIMHRFQLPVTVASEACQEKQLDILESCIGFCMGRR